MRRAALAAIFLAVAVIALGYASAFLPNGAPPVATYVFAVATAVLVVAVLVLGAVRNGRPLGALKWIFTFCFTVIAGGFTLALRAPVPGTSDALWLGLPRGAAIILYVIGVLPLLVLPLAYAATFERTTLSDTELQALRQRLDELRANGASAGTEARS